MKNLPANSYLKTGTQYGHAGFISASADELKRS